MFTHNLPPIDSLSQPPHCIDKACISQLDVLEALQCLTPDKSSELDGIGPKLLKNCALALYIPVHHLFSISLASHTIPSEWKIHSITPIHKSGDKSLVSNYRPISLLCIISKVLERIIYKHLSKFVLEHNLISISQYGFRKYHSITQQLLLYLDRVHKSLNVNAQCDVIYLDFRKAFDSVPHNELLLKFWNVGITGNTWHWIKEYLTGRLQCVNINGFLSPSLPVISGVPQGSIFGPLYYFSYTSTISQHKLVILTYHY